MERNYTDALPARLLDRLRRVDRQFRRRSVLAKVGQQWEVVCCTVDEILPGTDSAISGTTYSYPQAALTEDLLTSAQCLQFAMGVDKGVTQFDDHHVHRAQKAQWLEEQLPVNNPYMARAGYAFSQLLSRQTGTVQPSRLLLPGRPFYPDVYSAAKAWLPLREYSKDRDGRNGQVIFLLPETRAYIADAYASEDEKLEIVISGEEVESRVLRIKGAYWAQQTVHQLDAQVVDSKVTLAVPLTAERLEYFLIDDEGAVYDGHMQDRFSVSGPGSFKLGIVQGAQVDQVSIDREGGEGLRVEFKPFVPPNQSMGSPSEKTKIREIVTTVVAFANTSGGRIYIGIDDDGTIAGVNRGLAEWGKSNVDDSILQKYCGALKSRIKEWVHGDVTLVVEPVKMPVGVVVIISVSIAESKPVSVNEDGRLYIRKGATNRRLDPDQWVSVLK
jgi:hypothetical protein